MKINGNTKIGALIKADPRVIDAIISISDKFEKLRNPILRKLIANRATISMASKIGGCTIQDFFDKLAPLGFTAENNQLTETENKLQLVPEFMRDIKHEQLVELDVRPALEKGNDPLTLILAKIKTLKPGEVLKLINTFEPFPLIALLKNQGFESYVEKKDNNLVITYFYRAGASGIAEATTDGKGEDFDLVAKRFEGKLDEVDVREMEMPKPMLTILEALDKLPEGRALFVRHKRIPVFLLPELEQRKFEFRIKEVAADEVLLLIFR